MPPDGKPPNRVIVLSGPTGVGKSEVAVALAPLVRGEVVNYDSIQIYRAFDIGSAKPSAAERAAVPHHLYDAVEPDQEFNAAEYAAIATPVCREILDRGGTPILVGGTGFYLRALLGGLPPMPGRSDEIRARLKRIFASPRGQRRLHGWLGRVDPVSASRISPADRHRIERALEVWLLTGHPISTWRIDQAGPQQRLEPIHFALTMPRSLLLERLDRRVDLMYEGGLVAEVRGLLARYPRSARPFASIGYREAVRFLDGELSLEEAIRETRRRTRAYSKRQMTWLRSEPGVRWVERGSDSGPAIRIIVETLQQLQMTR